MLISPAVTARLAKHTVTHSFRRASKAQLKRQCPGYSRQTVRQTDRQTGRHTDKDSYSCRNGSIFAIQPDRHKQGNDRLNQAATLLRVDKKITVQGLFVGWLLNVPATG